MKAIVSVSQTSSRTSVKYRAENCTCRSLTTASNDGRGGRGAVTSQVKSSQEFLFGVHGAGARQGPPGMKWHASSTPGFLGRYELVYPPSRVQLAKMNPKPRDFGERPTSRNAKQFQQAPSQCAVDEGKAFSAGWVGMGRDGAPA